jgi:osmotically-inducible protein OsmY
MHMSNENPARHEHAESDARLRDGIHEQLKRHTRVDASKIDIVVRDGPILLLGSVASESERVLAGEVAANVAGRLNVINHIHVFQSPG